MTMEHDTGKLSLIAAEVRRDILRMISAAGRGHIGGSLSVTDILVFLYFSGRLSNFPTDPTHSARDRIIYSKGHACEAIYAVLARAGYFPLSLLDTYCKDGAVLGGHPDLNVPGIEMVGGSLGHGLGIALGKALAARLTGAQHLNIAILGDGECYEGSVWEAACLAAHHGLSRLIAIIDRNREITLHETEDCNRLEPFADKWNSFGWKVLSCNGHDFGSLQETFLRARELTNGTAPIAIIAETIKGKGVSFMEKEVGWHHAVPRGEKLEIAKRELGLA